MNIAFNECAIVETPPLISNPFDPNFECKMWILSAWAEGKQNKRAKWNARVFTPEGMVTRAQCRRLGVHCPHGGIHLEDMRRSRLTHATHEGRWRDGSIGEEDELELHTLNLNAQRSAASSHQQENSGAC